MPRGSPDWGHRPDRNVSVDGQLQIPSGLAATTQRKGVTILGIGFLRLRNRARRLLSRSLSGRLRHEGCRVSGSGASRSTAFSTRSVAAEVSGTRPSGDEHRARPDLVRAVGGARSAFAPMNLRAQVISGLSWVAGLRLIGQGFTWAVTIMVVRLAIVSTPACLPHSRGPWPTDWPIETVGLCGRSTRAWRWAGRVLSRRRQRNSVVGSST